MIQIYGSPRSSGRRCFWMLEEIGTPFERQALDMQKKEHKAEKFLKLNPNGKVPCLTDGAFTIWESLAINFYLADKYLPALLGSQPEQRGLIQQWSYWSGTELQPPLVQLLIQTIFVPPERKSQPVIDKSKADAKPLMQILDDHLAKNNYLVGDKFTLADLNVGSVVDINLMLKNDISEFKSLSRWMKTLTERPAYKKVAALDH